MTGSRTLLPLAHVLSETVDTGHVLSTVPVRPHPRRTLFSVPVPCRRRALSSFRDSSVAEADPLIPSHNPPPAIRRCP